MPGHDATINGYDYDLTKAKAFLAKSKYGAGDITLAWDYIKAGAHEEMGLLLQSNLKAIGVDMKITAEQWSTLSKNAAKADTAPHFFPVYNTAKYPTPDAFTYAMYHPVNHGQWQASAHFSVPGISKLLEEARATPDSAMRNKKYGKATKMIVEDAASLWVGYTIHRVALRDTVKNYENKGLMAFDLNVYDLRH
jgi:ABC-type transport system substrate-binding protein